MKSISMDDLPVHLILEILSSGRLSAADLVCLELTSRTFCSCHGLFPQKFRSLVDFAAFRLCESNPIYVSMRDRARGELFNRCGGNWKLTLRFLQFVEQSTDMVQTSAGKMQIKSGRYHTLLVNDLGVYSCGSSLCGVLGHGSETKQCVAFRQINFPCPAQVIQVSASHNHAAFVTQSGEKNSMDSTVRTTNYVIEEDKLLCHVYLDVSQNPIIGINQSKDRFWSRIEESFNSSISNGLQERNKRSMQCRMQVILRAVRKLCGCVSIIEKLKPSGASEEDILNKAKDLMMQDSKFARGFKFDHVWPIMKDMEKFSANDSAPIPVSKQHVTNLDSSQSDTQEPESPISGSPRINSFSINLSSDENAGGTPSQRPLGVKKSKLKKKREENVSELISTMKEGHRELINVLQKGASDMQQNYDIKMLTLQNDQKRLEIRQQQGALATLQEENKVLYMDLSTIGDPEVRQIVQNERARIKQKRDEERRQYDGNTFGKYFGDFGGSGSGSGSDFPNY